MEKFAVEKKNRISAYRSILQQKPKFFHIEFLKKKHWKQQKYKLFSNDKKLRSEWLLAMSENFTYDATFPNNTLVVGQTGCGKTSFVQSLGKNKMFGDGLLSVDWVPKINLIKAREDEIKKCFEYTKVEFHHPNDTDELDLMIEIFKRTLSTSTIKRRIKILTVTFLESIKNLTGLLLWATSQV